MSEKLDMLKIGMGLMNNIEPILKEIILIKGSQEHGKQDLIASGDKFYAVYREYFENESDALHFVEFCNRVYAMKKDQLPPIHILLVLFKTLMPIITPKKLKGKQAHGQPEIRKADNGKYAVILKEAFTEKDDAINHLQKADKIKSMRI